MERSESDVRAEEEAQHAADEAAKIGGPTPPHDGDEADRPLEESGEGESEGFEVAERDLTEQATHSEDRYSPRRDAFSGEVESDRSAAEYAESDEAIDPESTRREAG